ncbi:unnamed protein product [Adineta steineri]|uniref:Uncharacterized protein n=1 Tax=Adineta steineri TaxID=433720 RepID=A0A818R7G1_9BILA|nr:unnamed protein product [Adineta steineri]CAF3648170.1 unnamed protein product [Adineta steineri]
MSITSTDIPTLRINENGLQNFVRFIFISLSPDTSFFLEKTSSIYFDLHRIPNQSLLKLGGKKLTDQFVPYIKIAHGPGAIFPLICARQRLFSIDHHHEGGIHHSYIIPADQREALQKLVDQQNSSIQHPNEFIILAPGTLAQSYTEDVSWTESINFALPIWVEEDHANISLQPCQCHIEQNCVVDTIDVTLFKQKLIEKYVTSYLKTAANDESPVLIGTSFC